MLKFAPRWSCSLVIVLLLFVLACVCGPVLAAPTMEDPAPAKNEAEQAAGEGAEEMAPEGEAAGDAVTPEPTVDAKAAEEACKKAVAGLRTGDTSAVEGLDETQRRALLIGSTGVKALTCLAIAGDDKSRCDLLADDAKKACLDQWKLGRELKEVPKEDVKAQLLYRTCASNSTGVNCDLLRDAVKSGDPERCKDLDDAAHRAFCEAVASGEVKKCDNVPEGAERAYCAAFATNDASRCPKEAPDCVAMARGFAALEKGGLEGFKDIDATIAAAAMGTKVCDGLLGELEKSCSSAE